MIPSWFDARRPPPTDQGYLRAAHYFGDGWPINCWSTMNPQQARADFAQMREDGFNAVILVVPYRGFQVTQSPPRYEKHYFKLLQQLIREASRAHLWVILRIGYAHHICDKAPVMSGELTRRQITDSQYDAPWLHYLKRLRRVLAPHRNVRHLFLCWEEFWHGFMWMTRVSEKKRRELTPGSGYAEYLGDPGAIIPQESEPAFEHFHRFANQRLREIYTRCREVFPELGFEFRVDKDPLHNADGSVSWLSNDYMLDSGALRLSYWAPFIGARNEGEELSVEEALGLLRYNLSEQTNEGNDTRLLIDQFNFIDDTHKYVDQHARLNDDALPDFLSACAELLPQYSEGYGLWAWRDYRQNHLFNPDFRMGLAGWQATAGRPRRLRWGKEGVMLKQGDCLGQDFNALGHGMHARFQTSHCTLELTVGAASDVSLEASLDDQHFVALRADEVSGTLRCELPIDPAIYKSRKVKFRLRVVSGQAQLLSTSLYQYDYQVGVRGIDGEPGPYLALVREFNKALAANGNA